MQWLLPGLFVALAAAFPREALTPKGKPVSHEETVNLTKIYSSDDFHANVMAAIDPALIISSSEFKSPDFWTNIRAAGFANRTFYMNDTRRFVELTEPEESGSLHKRQESCVDYTQKNVVSGHAYWSPWQHMTGCDSTYGSGAGGSLYYSTEVSITTSYSVGISGGWDGFLSIHFGFEVSTTHGIATGFYCNLAANDIGQIWGRHLMAWALVEIDKCNTCSDHCQKTLGWVDSPAADDSSRQQFGCSTNSGGSHLRCS